MESSLFETETLRETIRSLESPSYLQTNPVFRSVDEIVHSHFQFLSSRSVFRPLRRHARQLARSKDGLDLARSFHLFTVLISSFYGLSGERKRNCEPLESTTTRGHRRGGTRLAESEIEEERLRRLKKRLAKKKRLRNDLGTLIASRACVALRLGADEVAFGDLGCLYDVKDILPYYFLIASQKEPQVEVEGILRRGLETFPESPELGSALDRVQRGLPVRVHSWETELFAVRCEKSHPDFNVFLDQIRKQYSLPRPVRLILEKDFVSTSFVEQPHLRPLCFPSLTSLPNHMWFYKILPFLRLHEFVGVSQISRAMRLLIHHRASMFPLPEGCSSFIDYVDHRYSVEMRYRQLFQTLVYFDYVTAHALKSEGCVYPGIYDFKISVSPVAARSKVLFLSTPASENAIIESGVTFQHLPELFQHFYRFCSNGYNEKSLVSTLIHPTNSWWSLSPLLNPLILSYQEAVDSTYSGETSDGWELEVVRYDPRSLASTLAVVSHSSEKVRVEHWSYYYEEAEDVRWPCGSLSVSSFFCVSLELMTVLLKENLNDLVKKCERRRKKEDVV